MSSPDAGFAVTTTFDPNRYGGRITIFVIFSCMVATMGGIIFGYIIGISGEVTSRESFLEELFPPEYVRMKEEPVAGKGCRSNNLHLITAITSSLYISGIVASFVASWVTTAHGRRRTMVCGGAACMAGAGLSGATINAWMFLLGRLLLGVGVGFTNQVVPLYLSEMAPVNHRGAVTNGFQFSIVIGLILASLVNFGTQKLETWGWRISLALAMVPAACFSLGSSFLPETPSSLLQRKAELQKVVGILQKMRGTSDILNELNDIADAAMSNGAGHPLQKITQIKYRPQLVMAIAIPFLQQVTGFNLLALYAPELFEKIGFNESASLISQLVLGLISIISIAISMVIVDRFGRRALFMICGVLIVLSQVTFGGIMLQHLGDEGVMSKGYAYLLFSLICINVMGFELSWGPLGWLVPSEIFPLEIRSVGQSIVVAVSLLFTFIFDQISLSLLCNHKPIIFFFFGAWVVMMTILVYFLLPETQNIPIEQMELVWKEHWFWGRMVGEEEIDELGDHM